MVHILTGLAVALCILAPVGLLVAYFFVKGFLDKMF